MVDYNAVLESLWENVVIEVGPTPDGKFFKMKNTDEITIQYTMRDYGYTIDEGLNCRILGTKNYVYESGRSSYPDKRLSGNVAFEDMSPEEATVDFTWRVDILRTSGEETRPYTIQPSDIGGFHLPTDINENNAGRWDSNTCRLDVKITAEGHGLTKEMNLVINVTPSIPTNEAPLIWRGLIEPLPQEFTPKKDELCIRLDVMDLNNGTWSAYLNYDLKIESLGDPSLEWEVVYTQKLHEDGYANDRAVLRCTNKTLTPETFYYTGKFRLTSFNSYNDEIIKVTELTPFDGREPKLVQITPDKIYFMVGIRLPITDMDLNLVNDIDGTTKPGVKYNTQFHSYNPMTGIAAYTHDIGKAIGAPLKTSFIMSFSDALSAKKPGSPFGKYAVVFDGTIEEESKAQPGEDLLYYYHPMPWKDTAFTWMGYWVMDHIQYMNKNGISWDNSTEYIEELKTLTYMLNNFTTVIVQESRHGWLINRDALEAGKIYNDIYK